MSIPLDRLYNYIDDVVRKAHGDSVLIYRFWPHGSKKIEDLVELKPVLQPFLTPEVICHDQEPLNFELYQGLHESMVENPKIKNQKPFAVEYYRAGLKNLLEFNDRNLRYWFQNIYDKCVLVHSEKNSRQVKKYSDNGFIPCYYWSHAVIAQDWYRYAQHVIVDDAKSKTKTFLIYNRAWSGSREYRLKFVELLLSYNLLKHCQTTFNPCDNGVHYQNYVFENDLWKPNLDIEHVLPINSVDSHASADFDLNDYTQTDIEIVLETLFEDTRWHLTEKSLRPIACGKPFVLAATPGSLNYLKSYGFKTFDTVWDESYDQIQDHHLRLKSIVALMHEISQWSSDCKNQKLKQAKEICEFNKRHFFSQTFSNMVLKELADNLTSAVQELIDTNTGQLFLNTWQKYSKVEELENWARANASPQARQKVIHAVVTAKQHYQKSLETKG